MGRMKATDEKGNEVWIHDSYLDNYLEEELHRLSNSDDLDFEYWFGHRLRARTEELQKENEVLRGEIKTLKKTKEEKLTEELWIQDRINYERNLKAVDRSKGLTMTVEELITELYKLPKDLVVLGRGYESGFNELEDVEIQKLVNHPNNAWYDGKYQDPRSYENETGSDYVTLD